jgi:hypothetical protein
VIRDLRAAGEKLTVKDITTWYSDRHGEDHDRKVTTKWIGYVIRQKLRLRTQKSRGTFLIATGEEPKLARLFEKYGIDAADAGPAAGAQPNGPADEGEAAA